MCIGAIISVYSSECNLRFVNAKVIISLSVLFCYIVGLVIIQIDPERYWLSVLMATIQLRGV